MTHKEICRRVVDLYRGCPRSVRWHVRGRLQLCPFDVIAAELPSRGVLLDVGCGYGHFCWYLSFARKDLRVLGSDVDGGKVAVARSIKAPPDCAVPEFRLGDTKACEEAGAFSGIAVLDVLYLLSEEDQYELLAWTAGRLEKGGVLVVKALDTEAGWRSTRALLQEWLMVHVLRRTSRTASRFGAQSPAAYERALGRLGLEARVKPLDTVNPSVLIVGTKQ